MSFSHKVTQSVTTPGGAVSPAVAMEFIQDKEANLDHTIAIGTDVEVQFPLDVSAVESIILLSTANVTIETNDGSSPDNTLALLANKPYVWNKSSYDTFKFTTDIVALFLTAAAAGTLKIRAIVDPTP